MTLIARSVFNGVPSYFGDLLLSREHNGEHFQMDIPALRNINNQLPDNADRQISGMAQKLNRLSDRLFVSWAGSYIQARAMLRDLKELEEATDNLTRDQIMEMIMQVPEGDRDDLAIIGTYCTPNDRIEGDLRADNFTYAATKYTKVGEEITVAGSGAETFMGVLPSITEGRPPPSNIDEGLFEWVEQTNFALLGQFVGEEMLIGNNLLDWWGGAFEIATVMDQAIRKVDDILFTFWKILPDHNGESMSLRLIPKFLKYDYIEDVLVVQKLECTVTENQTLSIDAHDFRCYTPILKTGLGEYDFSTWKLPDLKNKTLCCFTLNNDNGEVSCGNRIYHDSMRETPFEVRPMDDGLHIGFQGQLLNDLENDAGNAVGMPVRFNQIGA